MDRGKECGIRNSECGMGMIPQESMQRAEGLIPSESAPNHTVEEQSFGTRGGCRRRQSLHAIRGPIHRSPDPVGMNPTARWDGPGGPVESETRFTGCVPETL